MGVSLNHPTDQSVNWFGPTDGNWSTIESSYHGRRKSDTSVVTVSSTTAETVLMSNTSIPANALGVGTVLNVWSAGNVAIPATTTPTLTFRLRWGGLTGVLLASLAFPIVSQPAFTGGWVHDFRITGVSTGASGSAEVHGIMIVAVNGFSILESSTITIDTTTAKTLVWTVQSTLSTVTTQQRLMVTYQA